MDKLEVMLTFRKQKAYGHQNDYFDHQNCIGWTREGDDEHENSGCAVIISNGDDGSKVMHVGERNANKIFVDYLGNREEEIVIGEDGTAEFLVQGRSVSLWAEK